MPKVPMYTLAWSSAKETYELYETRDRGVLNIVPESPAWYAWLEQASTFAFVGKSGHYTARKEAKQRGGRYWYAYLTTGEHLAKKYLGKSHDLTMAQLEHIAGMPGVQIAAQIPPPVTLAVDTNSEVDVTQGPVLAPQPHSLHPVLATWVIRSKTGTSRGRKITFPCLQTQEGWCGIRRRHKHPHARTTLFSCDGDALVMAVVLTPLRRLKNNCWQALSSRLTRWTKPLTSSLPLATLTDLGQSKSELVAENTLLRQQLIILRRQVKRPTCTKTDRILLVLLAKLIRTWQQALLIVQSETLFRLPSEALSLVLEAQIKGSSSPAQGRRRKDCLDQSDGQGQSTLGC